jgi:hypothetical protein
MDQETDARIKSRAKVMGCNWCLLDWCSFLGAGLPVAK